jgi:hypothetical protein
VPADLRLLQTFGLQCDESVLTGESLPADKRTDAPPANSALGDLTSCAFMGTVVRAGTGQGVVVATGPRAEFGRIAVGLGELISRACACVGTWLLKSTMTSRADLFGSSRSGMVSSRFHKLW